MVLDLKACDIQYNSTMCGFENSRKLTNLLGFFALDFISCAENSDVTARLLPISVLFSGGENSAEIYRP